MFKKILQTVRLTMVSTAILTALPQTIPSAHAITLNEEKLKTLDPKFRYKISMSKYPGNWHVARNSYASNSQSSKTDGKINGISPKWKNKKIDLLKEDVQILVTARRGFSGSTASSRTFHLTDIKKAYENKVKNITYGDVWKNLKIELITPDEKNTKTFEFELVKK